MAGQKSVWQPVYSPQIPAILPRSFYIHCLVNQNLQPVAVSMLFLIPAASNVPCSFPLHDREKTHVLKFISKHGDA